MPPRTTHHRRRCRYCRTAGTRVTRRVVRHRIPTYRWSCGACARHTWLPAPAVLWISLIAGAGMMGGGLVWLLAPGLTQHGRGGALLAPVFVGGAMVVWAMVYVVPMLQSPRTD